MDSTPTRRAALERPLVRGLIAALLLAALTGGVLAVRAQGGGDGDGGATLEGAPTRSATERSDEGLGPLDGRRPFIGEPAPDFVLRTPAGETVKLSDLRGKVVWINFWATWCTPCKKELPDIQKLYDEKRSEGLEVLVINWLESGDDARAFMESRGLSLPVLLDRGGVYDQYGLNGLPDSFFIDREGNLAALHYGFLNEKKMRERLAQAGLP